MEDRFVFSGPLGVFDGFGDYAIVLSYLRDRRNNLGFGIFFLILFGMGFIVLIPGGDWGNILLMGLICLLILANQYAVASGFFTLRQLKQRTKDREKYIAAGKYFAKDLNMADPISLTFEDGQCRLLCGKLCPSPSCGRAPWRTSAFFCAGSPGAGTTLRYPKNSRHTSGKTGTIKKPNKFRKKPATSPTEKSRRTTL